MKYGLIGKRLVHSYSKTIHELLGRYEYELMPMDERDVGPFLSAKEFEGINVTIPYKSTVIPYLDWISPQAKEIGAVNTIVKRNGVLCGYNTDYYGFAGTLLRNGFDVSGKNVLVLGSGGTSKTVSAVCRDTGAKSVLVASRTPDKGQIDYATAKQVSSDYIINTTPLGMYPNEGESAVEVSECRNVRGAVDVIFNPLRTKFLLDCRENGIPGANGLYMLVAQAMSSAEHFTAVKVKRSETEEIYKKLKYDTENIVLTGMPGSGKTTVGRLLAERTGKKLVDTDEVLRECIGDIADFIRNRGEEEFRRRETEAIRDVTHELRGGIISTGGGAVLRAENVRALRENGFLFFLDRRISLIQPDDSRPLSSSRDALMKLYHERRGIYCSSCDKRILNNVSPESAANEILITVKKAK